MFPDLRVVSNQTLHVMKFLRAQGYPVVVDPDDGRPLAYTTEKGGNFLADPTIMLLAGIPISVISSLVAAWLYDRIRRGREHPSSNVIFVTVEGDRLAGWNIHGHSLKGSDLQQMLSAGRRSAEIFYQSRLAVRPDPEHPLPIQLEHSGRVVGWASNLEFDDDSRSVKVVGVKIVDPVVEEAIHRKRLAGMSVAGVVTEATCSICATQYVTCDHIATQWYRNKVCSVHITQFHLAEISFVADPINPEARVIY
jgi:hypothetical protein